MFGTKLGNTDDTKPW